MYLVPSFCKPVDEPVCSPGEAFTEHTTLNTKRPATREIERPRDDGPDRRAGRGAMRSASTATVVDGARDGSEEAWDELMARYGRIIVTTGERHRLAPVEIAALQQTTWLRLIEALHGGEQPVSVAGWLAATAQRESLRLLKRAGGPRPQSTKFGPTRPAAAYKSQRALALDRCAGRAREEVSERLMK
jgi:DNA-directed RNA polymerase specialized sigma24 family protein